VIHPADLVPGPEGWRRARIDQIAIPVRRLVEPSVFASQEVFHISIPALDECGDGRPEPAHRIGSQKLLLHGGEVLISKLNPRKSRVLIVAPRRLPILASGEFIALEPRSDCDARYLAWMLRAEPVRRWLDSAVRSVTRSHQRIDPEILLHAQVWVPPLEMQRSIAGFLGSAVAANDERVTGRRRLLAVLAERRAAIVRAAVSGGLTSAGARRKPSGLSWLSDLPGSWRVAKLSLVAALGTGHTPSRSKADYWSGERDIPWLTTSDVEQFRDDRLHRINHTKESLSRLGLDNSAAVLHPAGTVALSRTASVGFSVIMGRPMATSQDFATWTCSPALEPEFLLLCLRAMRDDLLGRLAVGSTHKTIYMPDIQSIRVPLPPIDEQRRAVAAANEQFETIDHVSDIVQRQIPLLLERRDALISAAVAGEFNPLPDADRVAVAA